MRFGIRIIVRSIASTGTFSIAYETLAWSCWNDSELMFCAMTWRSRLDLTRWNMFSILPQFLLEHQRGSLTIRNKRLPLFLGPDRAKQRLKWSFINFAKNWPFMFTYEKYLFPTSKLLKVFLRAENWSTDVIIETHYTHYMLRKRTKSRRLASPNLEAW